VDLRPYIYSLEAQEDQPLTPGQAASRRFAHDPQLFHTDKRNNRRDHDVWLKLHIRNTGIKDSSLTFFTGWHD